MVKALFSRYRANESPDDTYDFLQEKSNNKGFTLLVEDDLVPKAFSLTTLFSVFNMFLPKSSSTNLRHKNARPSFTTGFTALELLVSISIFIFMTSLLFIESKQFNQGVILTNVARDVVVHIRTAQNYSLNVKKAGDSFNVGYGVHFDMAVEENTKATLFAFPKDREPLYSEVISESEIIYTMKNAIYIKELCAGSTKDDCLVRNSLDISFKRPNPDAIICADGSCLLSPYSYARITLSLPDGDERYVIVTKTGLVSVGDSL